jgi:hypothetical protein
MCEEAQLSTKELKRTVQQPPMGHGSSNKAGRQQSEREKHALFYDEENVARFNTLIR